MSMSGKSEIERARVETQRSGRVFGGRKAGIRDFGVPD
jgi:hypothetical protein